MPNTRNHGAESEEWMRLALQSGQMGAWDWNIATGVQVWSPELEHLLGLEAEQRLHNVESFFAMVHPADRAALQRRAAKVLRTGREYIEDEFRIVKPDGSTAWFSSRARVHRDEQGRVVRITGVNMDITERKRAEEAQLLANERFRLAEEASNGFIYDWDVRHDYVERSDGFTKVLGYGLDEIAPTGDAWRAIIHPDDLPRQVEPETLRPETGTEITTRGEYRVRHKDGHWVWMFDRSIIFFSPDGVIQRMIGSTVDITSRKHAEEALRASRHFLERLTSTVPSVIYVFDLAENRNIYTNRQIWEVLGYTPEEVAAMGEQFLPTVIHPDDWAATPPYLMRLFELKDGEVQEREYRIRHKNGSYQWWYSREMVFNRDPSGRPNQVLGSALDVTVRRAAEAALLEAQSQRLAEEQAYATRLQQLNLASVAIHAAPTKEAVLRLIIEEARSLVGATQVHADITGEYVPTLGIITRYGGHNDHLLTIPLIGRDGNGIGQIRVHEQPGSPLTAADEALLQQLAQIASVALENQLLYEQEQAARAQAEESNRLKDEFLATVSHELRTPLTAFLGYAQILLTRKRDEAYVTRTVEKMVRSAKTQAQLIEDLLDIARIVSGKLRLSPKPLDVANVIRAAIDTVRPGVEAKTQRLKVDVKTGSGTIIGDSNRLQQVVWNLLSNATKFTPPGGAIHVSLTTQGAYVQLVVSDSGQGIKAEFLPYVFDRFRQAESSSFRSHNGLGLGLAIVRHLVELHGGTVAVASDGEGCGATFTVHLPLAGNDRPLPVMIAASNDGAGDSYPPELQHLRMLLVDDQPDILELLHEILAPCGAIVRMCMSAHEALTIIKEWQPDVLVCDIAMPHNDGYWLIEQVRALEPAAGGNIPAVALTAYVRMDDRVQVLAAGFQQYVPKPVEPAVLRSVIAHLVRSEATTG